MTAQTSDEGLFVTGENWTVLYLLSLWQLNYAMEMIFIATRTPNFLGAIQIICDTSGKLEIHDSVTKCGLKSVKKKCLVLLDPV